jgi:hypothetical protein
MPLADSPAHPRPDPFMQYEKRESRLAAVERAKLRAVTMLPVWNQASAPVDGEAEGLPGDGFGDGPEFRFHGSAPAPYAGDAIAGYLDGSAEACRNSGIFCA